MAGGVTKAKPEGPKVPAAAAKVVAEATDCDTWLKTVLREGRLP